MKEKKDKNNLLGRVCFGACWNTNAWVPVPFTLNQKGGWGVEWGERGWIKRWLLFAKSIVVYAAKVAAAKAGNVLAASLLLLPTLHPVRFGG